MPMQVHVVLHRPVIHAQAPTHPMVEYVADVGAHSAVLWPVCLLAGSGAVPSESAARATEHLVRMTYLLVEAKNVN